MSVHLKKLLVILALVSRGQKHFSSSTEKKIKRHTNVYCQSKDIHLVMANCPEEMKATGFDQLDVLTKETIAFRLVVS